MKTIKDSKFLYVLEQFFNGTIVEKQIYGNYSGVDISIIRSGFGSFSLPLAYIEFLQIFGEKPCLAFCYDDMKYSSLKYIREIAEDLYFRNMKRKLPDNYFPFSLHQGYNFNFFKLDEGDNPPVYMFIEGDYQSELPEIIKINNSISEFLLSQLAGFAILSLKLKC